MSVPRTSLGLALVALLAGCSSNASVKAKRLGPGHYRLLADRCMAIDQRQLEDDLAQEARRRCPKGAGPLEALQPAISRKGSLLGECPRGRALQAEVRCQPASH